MAEKLDPKQTALAQPTQLQGNGCIRRSSKSRSSSFAKNSTQYLKAGQQSYASIGMSPDWSLFRKRMRTKEPDELNLQVRVCGEGAG